MAARILKERNIDFLLLEATEHVGGRALTLKGNPHINMGRNFFTARLLSLMSFWKNTKFPTTT